MELVIPAPRLPRDCIAWLFLTTTRKDSCGSTGLIVSKAEDYLSSSARDYAEKKGLVHVQTTL